jgi:hypothetical protein
MKSAFSLVLAALAVAGAMAAPDHSNMNSHLRQKRAWYVSIPSCSRKEGRLTFAFFRGQRRAVSSADASTISSAAAASGTFLTAVPNAAKGAVTISNTQAADAAATQSAQGVTAAAAGPISFSNSVGLGGSCDPNSGKSWCVFSFSSLREEEQRLTLFSTL